MTFFFKKIEDSLKEVANTEITATIEKAIVNVKRVFVYATIHVASERSTCLGKETAP